MKTVSSRDFSGILSANSLVFLLIAMGFSVSFLGLRPYLPDDFYIHLTIARNFAAGAGPYFNAGEEVMATSSLIWTLFLGGWLSCGIPWELLPIASAVICALSVVTYQTVFEAIMQRSLSSPERLLSGLLIAAALFVSGAQLMETPLALLYIGLSILTLQRGRYFLSGLLSAAAVFTRLECSVFLLCIGFWCFMNHRSKTSRWCAGALCAGVVCASLCIWYFGTIIPHTVIAKKIIYSLRPGETLSLLMAEFIGKKFLIEFPLISLLILTITAASLIIFSFSAHIRAFWRSSYCVLFFLPGLLVTALYILSRVFVFPWYAPLYMVPLISALLVATFLQRSRLLLLALGTLSIPLFLNLSRDALASSINPSWYSDFESGAKTRGYLAAGEYLSQRFPRLRLLTSEIGALGFTYRGTILDAAGLATPEALEFQKKRPASLKAMHGAVPLGFIERKNPELVVGLDLFLREFFSSALKANYYLEQRPIFLKEDMPQDSEHHFQQSKHLNIFIRKDVLDLPG